MDAAVASRLLDLEVITDSRAIPSPKDVERYSELTGRPLDLCVGQDHDGTLLVVPVMAERRRVHGLQLNTLAAAGYEFFDYPAVFRARPSGETEKPMSKALIKVARDHAADLVTLHNLSWPSIAPFQPSESILRFDRRKAEKGWSFLKNKKSLIRHRNKAKRELNYQISHEAGAVDETLFDVLSSLHQERWAFDGIASPIAEPLRKKLYIQNENVIVTSVIRNGEDIIAAHFGLKFGPTLIWHTPVINLKYLDYSPIELLLYEVVDFCESKELDILDFGVGNESYKYRFSNDEVCLTEIIIPLTWRGYLATIAGLFAPHLKAGISGLKRILRRIEWWYFKLTQPVKYFVANKDSERSEAEILDKNVQYVEVSDFSSFVDLARQTKFEVRRFQYNRLKADHMFICLRKDDEILSWGWAARGAFFQVGETGEMLHTEGRTVLFDFVTNEKWRNQGFYTLLIKVFLARHKTEDALIYARENNKASIKAILRANFKRRS